MTCLGCRQLSGAESSPGVALCCILPLQGGCPPLCNVLLLDPGWGEERKGLLGALACKGFYLARPAKKVALARSCSSKA